MLIAADPATPSVIWPAQWIVSANVVLTSSIRSPPVGKLLKPALQVQRLQNRLGGAALQAQFDAAPALTVVPRPPCCVTVAVVGMLSWKPC